MKTLDQIKSDYVSQTIDGRDLHRLAMFIPANQLSDFGLVLKDGETHSHIELTRDAVIQQLATDLDFAFEKALGKRGISAGLMHEVIKMWNWVLEDGLDLTADDNYAQYGLPHFKATARLYGLPNPIGDDSGDEYKYSAYADDD